MLPGGLPPRPIRPPTCFPDTRWTLIAHLGNEATARTALDQLCRAYWQPIHVYLMQLGHPHAWAQDLTQDFLEMVVRRRLLERADPVAGRLRCWLLAALRHFLSNARRYDDRQKRGAGEALLSLDHEDAGGELARINSPRLSPDEAFDRAWVSVLLGRVLGHITRQYEDAGKAAEFAALLPWLLDDSSTPQMDAARRAGMTITNFRVQLHRLRGRYREALRQEISATLEDEADYDAELGYLFRLVGRPG